MTFPTLTVEQRLRLLEPRGGKARVVIDTDTYNEIDDQFALVYALLSQDRLAVEAIYAAPFHNNRSSGPEDGMLRSYDEIVRVLQRLGYSGDNFVHHGSRTWLPDSGNAILSPAADDLIARAMAAGEGPLYVVAIGATTNVAAAILQAPEIIERIVVVWLGGHPTYWHHTSEFNLKQDMRASRLIFDCGVPLVRVPCINVTEHLKTTQAEMAEFVHGRGAIGEYLFEIFSAYRDDHYARSKELWDIGPIAWLVDAQWVESVLIHSPLLNPGCTWSHDPHRHLIREAIRVDRDAVFRDLFQKLERHDAATPTA